MEGHEREQREREEAWQRFVTAWKAGPPYTWIVRLVEWLADRLPAYTKDRG